MTPGSEILQSQTGSCLVVESPVRYGAPAEPQLECLATDRRSDPPLTTGGMSVRVRWGSFLRMLRDPLEDMQVASRTELVAAVRAVIDVDAAGAEDIIRSAEPFWDAMERAGGLVDSWGGGEFCHVLPQVLSFIQATAKP
ncbi:hypothetical protein ACQP00_12600 [Dactylosporangium sp. CS-047395]|uniref:hypothetical protein n=1 Tax=Dactylosporangium sp. CS-047395 TaxID=3239936 RepID=UPI003D8A1641